MRKWMVSRVKIIQEVLDPTWTEEDLRGVPAELREARALELATAEARQPFDLERGPIPARVSDPAWR
ncbi:MAG: hypothetical protein QM771_18220 [Nitrospira sp.]